MYEISYSEESAVEIDADTVEVDFTDKYRAMLRAGVLKNLYVLMGDDNAAIRWRAQYEEKLIPIILQETDNAEGVVQQEYSGI